MQLNTSNRIVSTTLDLAVQFWLFTKNFNDGVLMKENVQGAGGVVGNVVAGVLVYGDVIDVYRLNPRVANGQATTMEKVTYFLAWVGLASNWNAYGDAAIAGLKGMVKTGKLVLQDALTREIAGFTTHLALAVEKGDLSAAGDLLDESGRLFQKMVDNPGFASKADEMMATAGKGVGKKSGDLLIDSAKFNKLYAGTAASEESLITLLDSVTGISRSGVRKATIEAANIFASKGIVLSEDAVKGLAYLMSHCQKVESGLFVGSVRQAERVLEAIPARLNATQQKEIVEEFFMLIKWAYESGIPGSRSVISTATNMPNNVKGAYHALQIAYYKLRNMGSFKLEVTETLENGIRRIDAVMSDGTRFELKYVTKLDNSAIDKMIIQFKRDVELVGIEGIWKLNWVFRGTEVDLAGIGALRQKMQKILEGWEITPAEAKRQVDRIVQFWSEKGMPFD